jgi:hypothetical protein
LDYGDDFFIGGSPHEGLGLMFQCGAQNGDRNGEFGNLVNTLRRKR